MSGNVVAEVLATRKITAEQVRALRAALYNDGVSEAGEVDRLFAMDEAATEADPSWRELFVEAVTDYLVNQVEPQGYVSEENADWLIASISRDGAVKTSSELEILVKVLEQARSSPARLSAFALSQVKKAVLEGEGPLAKNGSLVSGKVSRDEAQLIRRILDAFGGDQNIAVTRAEAEVLFDINDATANVENDPEWNELFVKAIANCLMAASGYDVPSRATALRHEQWLEEGNSGVGGFLSAMAAGGLRSLLKAYRQPGMEDAWAERNIRKEAALAEAESVSAQEAEWLARRMGRDGMLHQNEKALLRFIRDEAPSIHPSLQSLIAKAA
jgi:hypothetical protein